MKKNHNINDQRKNTKTFRIAKIATLIDVTVFI